MANPTPTGPFWVSQKLEPKRAFRFIIKFKGMPDEGSYYATKATKPQTEVSTTEHQYLNHTFNFPGRLKWNTVTLTMVDPAGPDAVGSLHQMLINSGYIIPANKNQLSSISKDRAVSAAGSQNADPGTSGGDIEIWQLDAAGEPIETWTLRNAWVKSIKPSELDYSSEELSTIETEIVYDWAELAVTAEPPSRMHTIDNE